jgi:hypothetical protein
MEIDGEFPMTPLMTGMVYIYSALQNGLHTLFEKFMFASIYL